MLPVAPGASSSLLIVLLLVRFADEWFTFFPAGALESIRADVDLSYTQAGLLLTSLGAGGFLGHGFKVAADFVDRRRLAAGGAAVYGLCLVAIALGHTFVVLIAAGFVWGAASDAFVSGCEVTLIQIFRGNLGPILGRVNAFGAVGDLLGPLTLALAAAIGLGWRGVFALGGGLMLVYAGWIVVQKFPPSERSIDSKAPAAAIAAIVRDRRIILLALVAGLFGLLDEPFLGFTIAYFERVRGLSSSLATAIITFSIVAGLIGYIVTPRLAGDIAPRVFLLSTGALLAVAVILIVVAPVVPLQFLAAGAFGFVGAAFYTVLQTTYFGLHPDEAGTTEAVVSTIGLVGIGFPTFVGAISDGFGLTAGLGTFAVVPPVILGLLVLEAVWQPSRP